MRKSILITLLILFAAGLMALGGVLYTWHEFDYQPMEGFSLSTDQTDLEKVSVLWLDAYFDQFKGWQTPPDWQAKQERIDSLELLGDNFVQLDYSVYIPRFGQALIDALYLYPTGEEHFYQNQVVIRLEQTAGSWYAAEAMRPAAWQLAYLPEVHEGEEPQVDHFEMADGLDCTYHIENGTFFVTYDGGATFVEVPDGYEKLCNDGNDRYHEDLPDNGYIITPDLTAFLTFRGGCTYLLFSRDMGASWQEAQICDYGYWGQAFLSLTPTGVYAAFPADRAAGSDYYALWFSGDLEHWEQLPLSGHTRNFTCVFWPEEGIGYFSGCEISSPDGTTRENTFFLTQDNGASYELLEYPIVEDFVTELGFFPFDTVEKMYVEEGVTCMVVGQGSDGDYYEDGVLVSALYQSSDGINFIYAGTVDNTRKPFIPG